MANSTSAHILVVDDEAEVRALLRTGLEREGFAVSEAKDGASLMAVLEKGTVDLITLDVRLSGEDGFSLAREVRAKQNVPIVMLTGMGDMTDRVVGLELGADDYITKPFHMREVLARIRAVLRRYASVAAEASRESRGLQKSTRYDFDGWSLDIARRELKDPEEQLCELTTAEFNLLVILVERPGPRSLSRRADGSSEGSRLDAARSLDRRACRPAAQEDRARQRQPAARQDGARGGLRFCRTGAPALRLKFALIFAYVSGTRSISRALADL